MKFSFSTVFKFIVSIACCCGYSATQAQSNPNSVYSRFGLGLIEAPGSVTHFGLGGCTSAIADPVVLNLANPASYSFLEVTNLQLTAKGGYTNASNSTTNSKYAAGQIHELSMGFKKPGNKWGYAIGLTPYSSVDYAFQMKDTLSDSLTATYKYTGTGGLNKVAIGTSRLFRYQRTPAARDTTLGSKPDSSIITVHQLSVGMNANYIFGNITRENKITFDNSEHYATLNNTNVWTQGFIFEAGLLYKVNLTTRRDVQRKVIGGSLLQLGASYMLNGNLFADYSQLITSVRVFTSTAIRDTSLNLTGEHGRLKIPQRISVGFAYKIYNKNWGTLTFAADYKNQDWSKYKLAITSDANLDKGLNSSSSVSAGIEYKPTTDVNAGFFNRMNYRMGVRSFESALMLNNTRITQKGITAGISIPVIKSMSKFHIGAEFGNTGTTDAGLVREKYVTFMAGISLSPSAFDRWFRQVKYD